MYLPSKIRTKREETKTSNCWDDIGTTSKKENEIHVKATPPKNTLRNYHETFSEDDDQINSNVYKYNKNSRKLLMDYD